jgi:hypothetical protein
MKSPYRVLTLIVGLAIPLLPNTYSQDKKEDKQSGGGKQAAAAPHQAAAAPHQAAHAQQHVSQNSVQHHSNVAPTGTVHNEASVTHTQASSVRHQSISSSEPTHHSQIASTAQSNTHNTSGQSARSGFTASSSHASHVRVASNQNSYNKSQGSANYAGSTRSVQPMSQSSGAGGGGQYNQPQVTPNSQYNSGNNYGGNWSSANSHSDWNHSGQHSWNNNNYMWYQGGWLLITTAFNPFYVTSGYANNGYSNNGSLVSSVQSSLNNQGYYNGPIDGAMGPGTRQAIASYQNDNNLNVTGHINGPLLQSLQIQQN